MWKTVINDKIVTGTYEKLVKLTLGLIGNKIERV